MPRAGENIEQIGPWTLTYKRANGSRGTTRYTSKEQHLLALDQWTPPDRRKKLAPKHTVEEVAKEWLTYLEENGRTESTIKTYKPRLDKQILPP